MLSEMFPEGRVKCIWVPSKLNVADCITRATSDPVTLVNSRWYREGVLPDGTGMIPLIENLVEHNTFLTIARGISEFTPKEDNNLQDLGYFDTARR